MMPSDSPLVRLLTALRGDPEGGLLRRSQYYVFHAVVGGLAGFLVVAMATPSRDRGGEHGFDLAIYLAAIAAGAITALAILIIPRLLRPRDWPTKEEFRRGGTGAGNDRQPDR
jgi:H+/Cl- antiporter ClcA